MKVLWIGDAACGSGFGRASSEILRHMITGPIEVQVIGVNYRGNPHDEPYQIWPAQNGGDPLGMGMLRERVPVFRPDVVVVQTNPWNIPYYLHALRQVDPDKKIPMVGIIAVEGRNCVGKNLNGLHRAIFWTEFARDEARANGMTIPSSVVGLGVDREMFYPGVKRDARQYLGLPEKCWDAFIVGNVNRNQHRKRLDLSIIYFTDWWKAWGKPNAYLYLHAVAGSSVQMNLDQLAQYVGLYDVDAEGKRQSRLILSEPKDSFMGVSNDTVRAIYQSMDVHWNTGHGEGWGLTTLESMSCGVANMAGDIAAVGEWGRGGVILCKTDQLGVMPDVMGMLGAAPNRDHMITELSKLYSDPNLLAEASADALALASQAKFSWPVLARQYREEILRDLPVL